MFRIGAAMETIWSRPMQEKTALNRQMATAS